MRPDPFAWTSHPEAVLGLVVLTAAYAFGGRRHPAPPWRVAAFGSGVLLLLVVAVSPIESLSFHLLTAHLLQNVVLAEWAPALLVLGVPPALAAVIADRLPGARVILHPAFGLPLWLATYFLWHLPPAYDAALRHPHTLLHLEHACYLAAGRPVVAADTGFDDALPVGEGLLAFTDAGGAARAIEDVRGSYERHARAARALAEEYLDSDRVLSSLLERL